MSATIRVNVPTDLLHIFLTVHASPDMTVFNWQREVEELRAIVAFHVPVNLWEFLNFYGGDNDFSLGAVAFEFRLPTETVDAMKDAIAENPWLASSIRLNYVSGFDMTNLYPVE